MIFYIASKSQEKARDLRSRIRNEIPKFTVVASWIDSTDFGKGPPYDDIARQYGVIRDEIDIRMCDILILISENGDPSKGGRFVEMGIALALGKPVYLIGERENIFHWHPGVTVYATVDDFIRSIS